MCVCMSIYMFHMCVYKSIYTIYIYVLYVWLDICIICMIVTDL